LVVNEIFCSRKEHIMRHIVSLQVGLAAIKALDLTHVCRKIQEPQPEGKGWTINQTIEAEKWYRRYLELCLRHPNFPVVPNYPIDSMWHQHILDTRAYAEDCKAIFGEMLHHYPYFGLNGDADQRDDAFGETNTLYMKYFGHSCAEMQEFHQNIGAKDSTCYSEPSECVRTHNELDEVGVGASMGMNCNSGGSGTGCGQGCSRGGSPINFGHPMHSLSHLLS
jgi:hypothetical protein